jgi:hypothetical protein
MADCISLVRQYVKRILKPADTSLEILGMKALLLDDETVRWVRTRAARQLPCRCCGAATECRNGAAGGGVLCCAVCAGMQKAILGMAFSMQEVLEKEGAWRAGALIAVCLVTAWCAVGAAWQRCGCSMCRWPLKINLMVRAVFLVEALDAEHEDMKHLKAVV